MRILWVEDCGANFAPSQVAKSLFNRLLPSESLNGLRQGKPERRIPSLFSKDGKHELVMCLSYDSWLEETQSGRFDFDVALLDINLEEHPTEQPPLASEDFNKRAGLYIYHRLIRDFAFSPDNIALFSGEGATMEEFVDLCSQSMIDPPRNLFNKNDENYKKLGLWLERVATSEYQRLRRGVLDACHHLRQQIDDVTEVDLERSFACFAPPNPSLRRDWAAYRDRMEQYLMRLAQTLPLVGSTAPKNFQKRLVTELTSLWPGGTDHVPVHLPKKPSRAEILLARSGQRVLQLAHDWARRDLMPDELSTGDAAFLALLTIRSWGPWSSLKSEPFESTLLDLMDDPREPSDLRQLLEENGEHNLARSYRNVAARVGKATSHKSFSGFHGECEQAALDLPFDKMLDRSLTLLYQGFWHSLSPTAIDPFQSFQIEQMTESGILEAIACRAYDQAFQELKWKSDDVNQLEQELITGATK